MTLPCITDARRFDASAHLPFFFGDERVGWIRRADVALLARWPDVFEIVDAGEHRRGPTWSRCTRLARRAVRQRDGA